MATAKEAGWHVSRYNLPAPIPGTKMTAIVNLYKGNCAEYTPIEMYLLSVLDELDEDHPIIPRFARRGIICKIDEKAALESMGRMACAFPGHVSLTICPTIGCNFDCPYCFEDHRQGKMSKSVQDDVVALAQRMMEASHTGNISVTWFGGEPLLAPDVIEDLTPRLRELAEKAGGEYSANIITNGYLLTKENIEMLERAQVKTAQVTVDGLGDRHNATRHLTGGGPTFDRIIGNLKGNTIPFKIDIRHNVHEENKSEMDELEAFIKKLAKESGNDLTYYPALVSGSEAADARGEQVGILCDSQAGSVGLRLESARFQAGHGNYCGAHSLWSVGIDDKGNLYKCWESVDKTHLSFGNAHDWDPKDPLNSADHPDNLTGFLNTAGPIPDEECRECIWLPMCAGGCPYQRLFLKRFCVPFKDNPEEYVLALHSRIEKKGSSPDHS